MLCASKISLSYAARVPVTNPATPVRRFLVDTGATSPEAVVRASVDAAAQNALCNERALRPHLRLNPLYAVRKQDIVVVCCTGTRAAYDNDILLAHSIQWIQSQMRTQRSLVAERILCGGVYACPHNGLRTGCSGIDQESPHRCRRICNRYPCSIRQRYLACAQHTVDSIADADAALARCRAHSARTQGPDDGLSAGCGDDRP